MFLDKKDAEKWIEEWLRHSIIIITPPPSHYLTKAGVSQDVRIIFPTSCWLCLSEETVAGCRHSRQHCYWYCLVSPLHSPAPALLSSPESFYFQESQNDTRHICSCLTHTDLIQHHPNCRNHQIFLRVELWNIIDTGI